MLAAVFSFIKCEKLFLTKVKKGTNLLNANECI